MPAWLAPIAGAALGGLMQSRENRKTREFNERQADPATIREKYEAAGFNPLLGLGGPVAQANAAPVGSIVADGIASAGMMYADEVQKNEEQAVQQSRLEMENERLRQTAQRLALMGDIAGPKVPQRPTTPTVNTASPAQPAFNAANGENLTLSDAIDAQNVEPTAMYEAPNPLYQPFTDKDGETTAVPVGPGGDEFLTGLLIEYGPQVKQWFNDQWDHPDTQRFYRGGKTIYAGFKSGMGIPRDFINSVRKSTRMQSTPENMRKLEHIGTNQNYGFRDQYGDFYYRH